MTDRTAYEFGGYRFEPFNARLLCHGQIVPLTAKAARTFELLIDNLDVLVTKEELLSTVWPDAIVEENNLTQQIHTLRRALSLDGATLKIETVPRRGYRLVGQIQRVPLNSSRLPEAASVVAPVTNVPVAPPTKPATSWRWGLGVMAMVVVLGSPAAWPIYQRWHDHHESLAALARGEELTRQRNQMGAIGEFNRAIELDDSNARAYSALAWALQATATGESAAPRAIPDSPSVKAALQAAALDPNCGGCRSTAGFFLFYHAWRFKEAEVHFREAIRLSKRPTEIGPSYAMLLAVTGRPEQALREIEPALAQEPTRVSWLNIRASALYYARKYDDALTAADRILAVAPRDRGGWDWRSKALFQLGQPEEALRAISSGALEAHAADIQQAIRTGGTHDGLLKALDVTSDWRAAVEQSWRRATWQMLSGNPGGALDELERAVDTRRFNAINFGADPVYDPIRNHPRFQALLSRVGLAPWFPPRSN
jgi:DNA-binding winged helix-turn-helix (wHTH) protein/Flp pilus assembly protein TadD